MTSAARIRRGSTQRAAEAGDEADGDAARVGEQGREAREPEHAAPAPEHAREDVAAEEVRAERRLFRGAGERRADRLVGRVRREQRAEEGEDDDGEEKRQADRRPWRVRREAETAGHACVLSFGTSSTTSRSATMFRRM